MRTNRNSDRLREILVSTRHQIVSLKDIQMDMLRTDSKVANQIATQISALEEVYKHQLSWLHWQKMQNQNVMDGSLVTSRLKKTDQPT